MLFTCHACLYTFDEVSRPERCPDCGKIWLKNPSHDKDLAVKPATQQEQADYWRIQEELRQEEFEA